MERGPDCGGDFINPPGACQELRTAWVTVLSALRVGRGLSALVCGELTRWACCRTDLAGDGAPDGGVRGGVGIAGINLRPRSWRRSLLRALRNLRLS